MMFWRRSGRIGLEPEKEVPIVEIGVASRRSGYRQTKAMGIQERQGPSKVINLMGEMAPWEGSRLATVS